MAMTTSIKRIFALLLPMLLACSFLVPTPYAAEPATISAYGTMIYSPTSNFLYGIFVKDFTYGPPYGDDWDYDYIDMVADAGGNYLYYDIDKDAWERNDTTNFLGIPFLDYLAAMVDYANQRNIRTVLGCGNDYYHDDVNGDGNRWGAQERLTTIMARDHWGEGSYQQQYANERDEWIQWGKDMVSVADPWGMVIMDEPPKEKAGYAMSEQDYWDFAAECIEAWQAIKPTLRVITYNGGGSRGNRNLRQYHTNPLHKPNGPYDYILYTTVAYTWSFGDYATSHAAGTAQLNQWMQDHYIYGEVGALTIPHVGVEYLTSIGGNWEWYCEDIYDYCFNNCYGFWHFLMSCNGVYDDGHWNTLTNDHQSWNVVGQFWVDHAPS